MSNTVFGINPNTARPGVGVTTNGFRVWWNGVEGHGRFVEIEEGTFTNKASVPDWLMWLWLLIPEAVRNAWLCSFVMHDRMVSEFGQSIPPIQWTDGITTYVLVTSPSRREAAKWMKRGIKMSGRWIWMRWPLYQLVRLWDRWVKIKSKK